MNVLDHYYRCCGARPLARHKQMYCPRCFRAFDSQGCQIANWAWKLGDAGEFERTEMTAEEYYAKESNQ